MVEGPVRGGSVELEMLPVWALAGTRPPEPPPMSAGGMKGPCATWVCCEMGWSVAGIACCPPADADWLVEPVTSPNAAEPSVLQPAREADPMARPANAATLSA